MNNFVMRPYISSDKQKVKELYALASVHSEIGYRSGPWEEDFENIEKWYGNGGLFLVRLVDDKIIAMGGYRKMTDTIGHIRRMRVHPDCRRRGYALQILKALEKGARAHGLHELQLRTSTQQKWHKGSMKKMGIPRCQWRTKNTTKREEEIPLRLYGTGSNYERSALRSFSLKLL